MMHAKERAPFGLAAASGGNKNIPAQFIPESILACKSPSNEQLVSLRRSRREIVVRMARLKRQGFWARQHLDSLRDEYRDNAFALDVVDQLLEGVSRA